MVTGKKTKEIRDIHQQNFTWMRMEIFNMTKMKLPSNLNEMGHFINVTTWSVFGMHRAKESRR